MNKMSQIQMMLFLLINLAISSLSHAENSMPINKPMVAVNIGFEVSGLEMAINNAAKGLNKLSESLNNLSDNPNLSDEQNKKINLTLDTVNQLNQSISKTVENLPSTIDKSVQPILKIGNDFTDNALKIVAYTVIGLVIIILAIVYLLYRFVIKPSKDTLDMVSSQIVSLSDSLKTTAQIVEKSSEQNLRVIKQMRTLN